MGRKVLHPGNATADLFAGLGWAYGYDAGVRLSFAAAGAGNLSGQEPPPGSGAETFRFGYGEGDELERIVREATGQIADLETGAYGRIVSRNGAPFAYDKVGRRLDDDRFVYRWDWRGQLVSVTVKDTWTDSDGDGTPDVTPFAGHQVRYEYDAAGRLTYRWHYGKLPEGTTDDAQRPFIEKRVFVWEGSALAAEAAYNHDEALRWRKTYVPGSSGLDDAVQVIVEDAASATTRIYTLLRDELGTVLGLVAEDEGSDPAKPPVPVRYLYTPYGEAHAESGPELLRARFDGQAIEVQTAGGTTAQTVSNATTAAAGSLVLDWSLSLDNATLPANLLVERLAPGTGWAALSPEDVAVGPEPADGGISAGGGGPPARLLVLARNGWLRGASYRVRLTSGLTDDLGRRFGRTETLEWRVPEAPASGPIPAITFDKKVAPRFETWEAATDTVTGRFPGGQTSLFQGLWTDPVTGTAYARARWYDARNASWLSEDPLQDIDSPNLYAFVGHGPSMRTDPLGTCWGQGGIAFVQCVTRAMRGDENMQAVVRHEARQLGKKVGKEVAATAAEELSPAGVVNGLTTAGGYDVLRQEKVEGFIPRALGFISALPGLPSAIRHLDEVGAVVRHADDVPTPHGGGGGGPGGGGLGGGGPGGGGPGGGGPGGGNLGGGPGSEGSFGGLTANTPEEASFLRNVAATFGESSVFSAAKRFEGNIVIQRSDIPWSAENVRRAAAGNSPFVKNSLGEWERVNLHHVGRQDGKLIEIVQSHNAYDPATGGPLHIPGPGGPARSAGQSQRYWRERLQDAIKAGQVSPEVLKETGLQ